MGGKHLAKRERGRKGPFPPYGFSWIYEPLRNLPAVVPVSGACGRIFFLAVLSIKYQYTGALACWTVVFTPIGTAVGIVLGKIVDKNRAENVSGNGDGITFASAQAKGFVKEEEVDRVSPPI